MINAIRNLFAPKVNAKMSFDFPEKDLQECAIINRKSLNSIDNWIDEEAFKNSCFQYGVPDFIKNKINLKIGNALTYTDIMLYISKKHFQRINYLEIGVSVGKNFYQLINSHTTATFTGFDIEEINPVLETKLAFKSKEEWKTFSGSLKKQNSSFKKYRFNEMDVSYMSADVWDENSWAKLKGNKFNIVFSDALHTPAAILFEFEMLVKYDLLDEKFIIVWDDLVGKMQRSFYKIIKKYNKVYQIKDIYLVNINGWIGENEEPHSVGAISSFTL